MNKMQNNENDVIFIEKNFLNTYLLSFMTIKYRC